MSGRRMPSHQSLLSACLVGGGERISRELFERRQRRIGSVTREGGIARPVIDCYPCLHQSIRPAGREPNLQKVLAVLLIRRFNEQYRKNLFEVWFSANGAVTLAIG